MGTFKVALFRFNLNSNPASQFCYNSQSLEDRVKKFCSILPSLIIHKLTFALTALLTVKVNHLTVAEMNTYPNYLLVYTFQLLAPPLICNVILMFQILRNKSLRKYSSQRIKTMLTRFTSQT